MSGEMESARKKEVELPRLRAAGPGSQNARARLVVLLSKKTKKEMEKERVVHLSTVFLAKVNLDTVMNERIMRDN